MFVAFMTHRTDFRHPVVIENPRPVPSRGNGGPRRGHTAARLARDDDQPDLGFRQIDSFRARDVGQAQGVRRRATQHGGVVGEHRPQPSRAAHATSGDAKTIDAQSRFEGRPETQERAKRKRKEEVINGGHPGGTIDLAPVVQQPGPAFVRVEPAHRLAGAAAGLMAPGVALQRESEVRAVGRMGEMICR